MDSLARRVENLEALPLSKRARGSAPDVNKDKKSKRSSKAETPPKLAESEIPVEKSEEKTEEKSETKSEKSEGVAGV